MGKKVITKQDVQNWHFKGIKEVNLNKNTIVLPGAKDALMAAGIKIKSRREEDLLRQKIIDCCDEKGIDDTLKEKIIHEVIKSIERNKEV